MQRRARSQLPSLVRTGRLAGSDTRTLVPGNNHLDVPKHQSQHSQTQVSQVPSGIRTSAQDTCQWVLKEGRRGPGKASECRASIAELEMKWAQWPPQEGLRIF